MGEQYERVVVLTGAASGQPDPDIEVLYFNGRTKPESEAKPHPIVTNRASPIPLELSIPQAQISRPDYRVDPLSFFDIPGDGPVYRFFNLFLPFGLFFLPFGFYFEPFLFGDFSALVEHVFNGRMRHAREEDQGQYDKHRRQREQFPRPQESFFLLGGMACHPLSGQGERVAKKGPSYLGSPI